VPHHKSGPAGGVASIGQKRRQAHLGASTVVVRPDAWAKGQFFPAYHSTVTLFARLRGWSTSVPLMAAVW
jgi:hypothetical protein